MRTATDTAAGLIADRALLERTSTAERVAGILRDRICTGYFRPGVRLVEEEITEALGVSRNTLREAFRLLTRERLLTHQLNRGVLVRVLDIEDARDLYRVRKHVECSVARAVTAPVDVTRIVYAVEHGERAVADRDGQAMGTANTRFHEGIVALAGSARLDQLMSGVLAELRLAVHVLDDPCQLHEPCLSRHREIVTALAEGNGAHAEQLLSTYLDDAEQQLVEALAQRGAEPSDRSTPASR